MQQIPLFTFSICTYHNALELVTIVWKTGLFMLNIQCGFQSWEIPGYVKLTKLKMFNNKNIFLYYPEF